MTSSPRCSLNPRVDLSPDGTVWFERGATVFDGTSLVPSRLPQAVDPLLAFGADGSAWTHGKDPGLYVITPEAVAVAE